VAACVLTEFAATRVLLLPGLMRNLWSAIRERNAGSLPSSFDVAKLSVLPDAHDRSVQPDQPISRMVGALRDSWTRSGTIGKSSSH
jgi:hypothetical protein